jgi:DNA-binding MarR family transcriptional regulator
MATGKGRLDAVARDLNSAAIHLLRGLRAVDRRSGLTAARLSALSVLVFGGPCTLAELADADDVTSATMSRVVDGLVDLGLATRTTHPDSGRKVLITATDAGRDLMLTAQQRRIDVIASALSGLPGPERDAVASAADALRALAGRVPQEAARSAAAPRPDGPSGPGHR